MKKKTSEKLSSKWSVKAPLYIDKTDKRYSRHLKMLKECGFSDTETWSLYSVLSEFVLPRLKRFKKITNGFPSVPTSMGDMTMDKWYEILDKIIFAFDWALTSDDMFENKKEYMNGWKKYKEGMELFAEYFRDLWW